MAIEEIHFKEANIILPGDRVGESGYFKAVRSELGLFQVRHSCISCPKHEEFFRSFIRDKEIKHAVEIGTFMGTATAVLAHYAWKVSTMDIRRYYQSATLWLNMGVMPQITQYIISDHPDDKTTLLNRLDFDFAFIDGNHRDGVNLDWELTKKCGRVLFHDYFHEGTPMPDLMTDKKSFEPSPWILELVDSLPKDEVTIKEPFAYWEKR